MEIRIYGASDDLIEIEGDIRDEFSYWEDNENYLAFSDGTVLHIEYCDDGIWRIRRMAAGGFIFANKEAVDADGDQYSDVVTLTAQRPQVKPWVVHGTQMTRHDGKRYDE